MLYTFYTWESKRLREFRVWEEENEEHTQHYQWLFFHLVEFEVAMEGVLGWNQKLPVLVGPLMTWVILSKSQDCPGFWSLDCKWCRTSSQQSLPLSHSDGLKQIESACHRQSLQYALHHIATMAYDLVSCHFPLWLPSWRHLGLQPLYSLNLSRPPQLSRLTPNDRFFSIFIPKIYLQLSDLEILAFS